MTSPTLGSKLGEKHVRFVNFYQPIDAQQDPHPWRTTSWASEELAHRHAKLGALAIAVRVEFEAESS